jgi:hypothetical protein
MGHARGLLSVDLFHRALGRVINHDAFALFAMALVVSSIRSCDGAFRVDVG